MSSARLATPSCANAPANGRSMDTAVFVSIASALLIAPCFSSTFSQCSSSATGGSLRAESIGCSTANCTAPTPLIAQAQLRWPFRSSDIGMSGLPELDPSPDPLTDTRGDLHFTYVYR